MKKANLERGSLFCWRVQGLGFNGFNRFKGFKGFKGFRWRLCRILDDGIPVSSAFPSRGNAIKLRKSLAA